MKRILFVDDDEPFRLSFSLILEKAGYEIEQAEDGRVGLRKFKEHPPDLVICDLIMPDVEGLETMREIHEIDKTTKILAISGGGRVNAVYYLKVAQMMGAVVTLAKPFTREELIGAVEKLIGPSDESADVG
jgi:DNA-binding response OmpR family regulator